MKNLLLYNYNLNVEKIDNISPDNYSFYIDYDKYYFKKINRPLEDIVEIYEITNNKKAYNQIIKNRFSSITTLYEDSPYILIKVNSPENIEVDCLDIISDMTPYNRKSSVLNRTNWGELWSQKIDYLEYQVSELGTAHKTVRKSFSYYVGLAENAITYYNALAPIDSPTYLQHRRLIYPLFNYYYRDPQELVLDYRVRDIASYFKHQFFEGNNPIKEVKLLVGKNVLTPLEYNLLFTRLLYPSYYFDAVHLVLEKDEDDDYLLKYIEKVHTYEDFLNDVFDLFKTKSSMLKIDWLIKKVD